MMWYTYRNKAKREINDSGNGEHKYILVLPNADTGHLSAF